MPSHFHISFGIQDFFRFTFKSGSRDDKKADQDALKYNDADIIKVQLSTTVSTLIVSKFL